MSISVRNDILVEMLSTLQNITVANGYYSAVGSNVGEVAKDLYEEKLFPHLYLIDSDEGKDWADVDSLKCTLNFLIIGYIKNAKNDTATAEPLRKLMADVEKCICADSRRNMKALTTRLTDIKTDEGALNPYGVFNAKIIVEYHQEYGDPDSNG